MAKVTEEQVERVRALVAAVPPGSVRTYGDLAADADLPSPRIVGWVLRTDAADLPWHRIVPASGRPAAHLAQRQLAALRAEGVLAENGRIDLRTHRWAADQAIAGPRLSPEGPSGNDLRSGR